MAVIQKKNIDIPLGEDSPLMDPEQALEGLEATSRILLCLRQCAGFQPVFQDLSRNLGQTYILTSIKQ